MEQYSSTIDQNLGTTSSAYAAESTDEEPLYQAFTPSEDVLNPDGSGNSHALIATAIEIDRRQAAEGSVLLKNETANGRGLPLASGANVTLLGGRSHTLIMGSGMGTKVAGPCITLEQALGATTSTDFANTIATSVSMSSEKRDDGTTEITFSDPVATLSAWTGDEFEIEGAGLNLNPTAISAYEVANAANKLGNNECAVPNFDPREPSEGQLLEAAPDLESSFADYSDAAIVVLGRPSAESNDYLPGSVAEGTGASEPLELTDNERAAVELAKKCSDNVIVIINSSNAMEIRELADDDGVAAILSVGFPGTYGALGIADVIVGKANPSGALADIYPTRNMSAPAMQNMGDFTYSNISDVRTRTLGTFGDTSAHYVMECEGIYTGYKYYETRYFDSVLGQGNARGSAGCYASNGSWDYDAEVTYGFGYGLSYTTFTQEFDGDPVLEVSENENGATEGKMTFNVRVTNTGSVAGRSIVQIYGQAPYTAGGVEKSAIQLLEFGKTELLEPGQSETVSVVADLQYLASYDNSCKNADGTTGTYVMEPGTYWFATGNGAHDALNNIMAAQGIAEGELVGAADASRAYALEVNEGVLPKTAFSVSKTGVQVSNQLDYSDWNHFQDGEVTHLSRADWQGTWPTTYDALTLEDAQLIDYINGNYYEVQTGDDTSEIVWGKDSDVMFWDLAGKEYDDPIWDEALDKMTLEEAIYLATYGGPAIPGVSSLGTFEATMAENNGVGFSVALNAAVDTNAPWTIPASDANAIWTGNVLGGAVLTASTFDHDLMREVGEFVGTESLFLGYPLLWGPGLNTHRHAYNGRNGEYYSEDPVLTGVAGMEFALGAQEYGLIAAPKHFAFNDQETNRAGVAPYMTEQKAREGDLRAFQIAFEAGMKGTMTSFSKIGAVECTCSRGLVTNILKNEWGARGYFVTDIYDDTDLYASVLASGVTCFDTRGISGFDGGTTTIESTSIFANQNNGIQAGVATVEGDANLQRCVKESAHMVLYALSQSSLVNRYNSTTRLESKMTWWRGAYIGAAAAFGVLAVGAAASAAMKSGKTKKQEA